MVTNRVSHRPRNVREDVEWFHTNLKDQIDDRELEAKGVTLDFFWDGSEVRRAVLGAFYFFDPTFKKTEFDDDRTMIVCLAAQKWLGSIKMLEPHQSEFAKALRQNFHRNVPWLTHEQTRVFFSAIALPDSDEFSLSNLGRRNDEERAVLIAKYAGEAGRLFKAIQCAKGTWRHRLTSMYTGGILQIAPSSTTIDYQSIFGSKDFSILRAELDQQRGDKHDNNMADAVCLCLLQRQVKDFLDGNSKTLPRFFETTSTFRTVLSRTRLLSTVSYLDARDEPKTVLRGSDYFLFRAALTVKDDRVNSTLANLSLETLQQLSDRIGAILKASEPLRPEEVEEISVNGQPITEIIDDLKGMWILERIWLPFIAHDELKSLDEEERLRLEGFKPDPSLVKIVDAAIGGVTKALEANVDQYNLFRRLYIGIDEHVKPSRKRYEVVASEPERLYQISGIGRFGIPESYVEGIETLLRSLLVGGVDESSQESSAQLAKMCVIARTEHNRDAKTVAFALLWALEFHSAIVETSMGMQETPWVIAMFAAASLHVNNLVEARRGIRELEFRITSPTGKSDTESLATALSYLYFHLWREEGGRIRWRTDRSKKTARSESELQQLADDCIRYAEMAYAAESDPTPSRLYVLNILLFYLTEAGMDKQFQKANALANELMPWGTEHHMWQYRFDDTLARFFHRKALLARDPETRRGFVNAHKMYLKSAVDHNPGNSNVTSYAGIASNTTFGDDSAEDLSVQNF